MSMGCISCGHRTVACVDTRPLMLDQIPTVRRRRQCEKCGHRWHTIELPEDLVAKLNQKAANFAEPRALVIREIIAKLEGML